MSRPLAYEPRYALNAICPYFTMFPLEYPMRALSRFKREAPVVMDPFCGRGTTLFAARALGLKTRGLDTSPVAVAVARAKLARSSTEDVLDLARRLLAEVEPEAVPDSEFFRHCYDPLVLRAICQLREGLLTFDTDTDATVLLRAATLGCLHGPRSVHVENQSYFSSQMPRTFSSKPDYSVRYWKKHHSRPPKVDVLKVLERKLTRINADQLANAGLFRNVRLADSRLASSLPEASRDFSVVVTSPPYYGMKTYVEDQWLRNWFLGATATVEYGNERQLQHTGQDVFADSLGSVWRNMARTKSESLRMFVRFGIIPSASVDAKSLMLASLEASKVGWKLISVRHADTAAAGRRQARQMAAGSAAATEHDFHLIRV